MMDEVKGPENDDVGLRVDFAAGVADIVNCGGSGCFSILYSSGSVELTQNAPP